MYVWGLMIVEGLLFVVNECSKVLLLFHSSNATAHEQSFTSACVLV